MSDQEHEALEHASTGGPAGQSSRVVYGVDVEVGREYRLSAYTITEQELIDFARAWDPQNFHIDRDAAAAGAYGGLIASGIQTIAVYQRLAVQDVFSNWSVIAGRSLRDVRFVRPVRPGDTLSGRITIRDVSFDDHDRALVKFAAELTNQDGKTVIRIHADAYVRVRPPREP